MPINILMPALSPTMEKGNLAKWLKKEGDKVKAGDVIAEIETDKATMEFEAIDDGMMGKILVPEGTSDVAINQPIAVLLQEGEDKIGARQGQFCRARQAAARPKAGHLRLRLRRRHQRTATSAAAAGPDVPSPQKGQGQSAPRSGANGSGARIFASPLARRLAKDRGIDLRAVQGSGPHGRVVKADVENAPTRRGTPRRSAVRGRHRRAAAPPAMSDAAIARLYEPGKYDVVPHDKVRKIIARRLVEAKQTIPHFYLTVDTEIDALLPLRAEINAAAPRDEEGNADLAGVGQRPDHQGAGDGAGARARRQRHVDRGRHAAPPQRRRRRRGRHSRRTDHAGGAPRRREARVRDRDRDEGLRRARQDPQARARGIHGGATAVSNLGMFGVKDFAAVINPPHATILAVGAGIETPVVRDGKVEVRTIMT